MRVKWRGVHLYALKEEDESMREQYSASPSVIVFCHSVKLRIVKGEVKRRRATETPDWCGVEGGEDGQVGIEVVHLPKPLHNLYELHHVPLSLLIS